MGCKIVTHRKADQGRSDCAVAFCCDARYFPFALFVIRQIAYHNPERRFDFVVASQDALEIPAWAEPYGIHLHRSGAVPDVGNTKRFGGSLVSLYRILLAQELGHIYRRILYLDCDIFVEGGDFDRLMTVDLGPHPLAAVRDIPHLYEPAFHAREFKAAGMPAASYLNSGLLLIDTAAFEAQNVRDRCWASAASYPQSMFLADQSLLNLALHGQFAELAPCWNWQGNGRFPLVPSRYPVFMRHFIGPLKPNLDVKGHYDARFRQAYADFFRTHMPEKLVDLAPPCNPNPMSIVQASRIVLRHLQAQKLMTAGLARFSDPWHVRI
jgi:lipopolysaccharide biosynthesis glycosyltransferase